ncbi:MAG: Mov34/MPN/PAD-1 family protein, partial [Dehalococcoidales bacterium]|nr:Mov34/MPN/PAD-1 family protein [Dehalococcoidales bacterium]
NPNVAARVPVAECEVRGLAPMETKVTLTYGSIPQRFFDLALDTFLADPDREHYVAVIASAGYQFYVPVQDNNGGSVVYEVGESVVLEVHSHGHMGAKFSPQDDTDEKGLKLYGVVGKLNATPVVKLRVGVYGYFKTLVWKDIFDGSLTGAVEYEEKEVISECDVHHISEAYGAELQHCSRWLWWNWGLRR